MAAKTQVVLLRGINLGSHNRIAMPALREALAGRGFGDARTYVQSGNVVLTSALTPARLARACEELVAERFGFEIRAVARTRAELAQVVRRNPLGRVADDPRRYQVSFLERTLEPAVVRRLEQAAAPSERLAVIGREVYAWHPRGVARSKLWTLLAGNGLGVTATARNWTTVTTLLRMASD